MDKNKKRCKLSYFKKLLMLRELQQQGTLEISAAGMPTGFS